MQEESVPRPPQSPWHQRVRAVSVACSIRICRQPDLRRRNHRAVIRADQVLPVRAAILS